MIRVLMFSLLFSLCAVVQAEQDVCEVRPELCENSYSPKKKPVKKRVAKKLPSCREADDERRALAKLPICGLEDPELANFDEDLLLDDSIKPKRKPTRKPASASPRAHGTSFNSYLNANSSHPALSSSLGQRQTAFQEYKPVATMNPEEPKPAAERSPAASGTTATEPAVTPSQGNDHLN